MATQVQNRRGTTAEHSTFTGAVAELTVDTDKDTVVVHDGSTAGGAPLLREDQSNLPTSAPSNGVYLPSANNVAISTNGTGRLFIDSSGEVTVKHASSYGQINLDGATGSNDYGRINFQENGTIRSYITDNALATAWQITQNKPLTIATNNTERLRITADGKLGLGTSSPSYPLSVKTTTDSGQAILDLDNLDAGNYGGLRVHLGKNDRECRLEATYGSSFFTFYTDSAERVRIDSSGRVGIGTTTVSGRIHIGSTTSSDNNALVFNRGAKPSLAATQSAILCETNGISGSDSMTFMSDAGYKFLDDTGNSEWIRIDSSGRLLVNTSSSRQFGGASERQVLIESTTGTGLGILRNSNDDTPGILTLGKTRGTSNGSSTIVQNNDYLGIINFVGADGVDANTYGAQITCQVDGTPGADDLPSRLVFSTTADGASSPTERMRITSTGQMSSIYASGIGHRIGSTLSAGSNNLIQGGHSASDIANMTTSFIVSSNGNVTNTNNSYGAISDIKLKENIVDASSQWDDLKALQVRNYNFKEETGQQTHTQIGLIAQEAELVSPGLVSESPDRDEEGNDLGTVTKSVNYSVLYMKAVKALQEAMERIEVLEAKVNALEGN